MQENRIRIVDIAERLGLSTATVSNVIHGKTSEMSPRTAQRVWQELEAAGYIPDMAGVWLAQKSSRIIGVVVDGSPKYEGKVLEDGFVTASLNALSREASRTGYPSLTTVRQDAALRAGIAVTSIEAMGRGQNCAEKIVLPVTLLPRESTGGVSCQNL